MKCYLYCFVCFVYNILYFLKNESLLFNKVTLNKLPPAFGNKFLCNNFLSSSIVFTIGYMYVSIVE
jgi:hypothetical protein